MVAPGPMVALGTRVAPGPVAEKKKQARIFYLVTLANVDQFQ